MQFSFNLIPSSLVWLLPGNLPFSNAFPLTTFSLPRSAEQVYPAIPSASERHSSTSPISHDRKRCARRYPVFYSSSSLPHYSSGIARLWKNHISRAVAPGSSFPMSLSYPRFEDWYYTFRWLSRHPSFRSSVIAVLAFVWVSYSFHWRYPALVWAVVLWAASWQVLGRLLFEVVLHTPVILWATFLCTLWSNLLLVLFWRASSFPFSGPTYIGHESPNLCQGVRDFFCNFPCMHIYPHINI